MSPRRIAQLGLELPLRQALEFKYITAPLSPAEVRQGLIDVLYGAKQSAWANRDMGNKAFEHQPRISLRPSALRVGET